MRYPAIIVLFLAAVTVANAQEKPRIYLDPKDAFANEFSAGASKKDLPAALSHEPTQVHYYVQFSWQTNEGSKVRGVMTALATGINADGSNERVSMTILEAKSRTVVYSYTCQKGGRHIQSVAECLAKHWRNEMNDHKEKWSRLPEAADLLAVQEPAKEVKTQPATENRIIQSAELQVVPQTGTTATPTEESLGDVARRLREQKKEQEKTQQQQQR